VPGAGAGACAECAVPYRTLRAPLASLLRSPNEKRSRRKERNPKEGEENKNQRRGGCRIRARSPSQVRQAGTVERTSTMPSCRLPCHPSTSVRPPQRQRGLPPPTGQGQRPGPTRRGVGAASLAFTAQAVPTSMQASSSR
jgi:hypothetical protein